MCEKRSRWFGYQNAAGAAACTLVLGATSAYGGGALAEQGAPSPGAVQAHAVALRVADLEKAFWICDYVATTHGVHATPISTCAAVTDELKAAKFGGDFEQLLAWWRENKPAEHEELARGER